MCHTNGIEVHESHQLITLVKGMRAMDKAMSPWFIRDWCLKCFKYLRHTAPLVFNHSLAPGRSPSKPRLNAKIILDAVELESYEFLCLMANAFNRQQLIKDLHNPNFNLNKKYMRHNLEKDDDPRFFIYEMDDSKEHFVGKVTPELLPWALDELFDRMVASNELGPRYRGYIDTNLKFPDLEHISELGPKYQQWEAKWSGQQDCANAKPRVLG